MALAILATIYPNIGSSDTVILQLLMSAFWIIRTGGGGNCCYQVDEGLFRHLQNLTNPSRLLSLTTTRCLHPPEILSLSGFNLASIRWYEAATKHCQGYGKQPKHISYSQNGFCFKGEWGLVWFKLALRIGDGLERAGPFSKLCVNHVE
jgi:hypothetical protein